MERTIETQAKDSWGCVNSNLPYPLYFYAYSRKEFGDDAYANSIPMTQAPTIQNVMYCPFVYFDDLSLIKIPYDKDRFGTDPLRPAPSYNTYVYRVKTFGTKERQLGYVLPYRNIDANPGKGKPRSWKNESKLWQYPYRKIFISDGMNTPLELKTYLFKYNGVENKIMVRLTMSNRMSYGIYVTGYKGDDDGTYEAMVSGDSLELPCSSSAYTQWYATSKNQTATQTKQIIQSSFLNTQQQNTLLSHEAMKAQTSTQMQNSTNLLSNVMNPLTWLGLGGTVLNNSMNTQNTKMDNYIRSIQQQQNKQTHAQTEKFAIQSAIAQSKDSATTPPTMISMGSDFMYGYNNHDKKLKVSTFDITPEVARQLGDYFALYGYMANKMMDLKTATSSRYYYNYVKTTNASVRSKNSVPKIFVDKINAMFNNGVTLWHKENSGVIMHDYTYDNYEVNTFWD